MQAAPIDLDSAIHDLDDVALICGQVTVHAQLPVEEIAKRHVGPGRGDSGYPCQGVRRLAVEDDRIEPVPLSVVALNDGSRAADLEIGLDTAQVDSRVAQCRRRRGSRFPNVVGRQRQLIGADETNTVGPSIGDRVAGDDRWLS